MAVADAAPRSDGGVSLLYDPRIRSIFYQVIVFGGLVLFLYWIIGNTIENLRNAGIASGFSFLNGRAGFDLSQALIPFSSDSNYWTALQVGLLNTIMVAVLGIVLASIVGFLVGIGRLSRNWLIRKISLVYVEIFRNIPPLLVIFFWYFAVLSVLPNPRDSVDLPLGAYLNNRGIFMPLPIWGDTAWLVLAGLVAGIVIAFFMWRWATARQKATGEQFPKIWVAIALIVGMPLLGFVLGGFPLTFEYPELGTFNLRGGIQAKPEFLSLYLALSFYTAAFIAEIVRAGILGISKGQTEASLALGLSYSQTLRLVIIPQAMRIIIPPLTSQYLNLTKNSSLAIAIGYPDLVAVGGTILNQSGQAVEIVAIWMVVYLSLSLATSAFMNWFNARVKLVER